MLRRTVLLLPLCLCALALPSLLAVGSTSASAGAKHTIRFATMAPRGSSFLRVFQAWGTSLKKETGGRVKMRMYPGGVAGDDRDVLRKMKAGQIDGGQFSSVAMGSMVREMLVVQVPGVARGVKQLNAVRAGMQQEWNQKLRSHGYEFMGWADVGFGRVFSNKPILRPADYKTVRPWVYKEDPIEPTLMQIVGASPVALGLPEVLPALQTGMIDTLTVSAVAAVALQWFRHLSHMSEGQGMVLLGATFLNKGVVEGLAPDDREKLMETSRKAHAALNKRIVLEEKRAVKSLKARGVVEYAQTAHQKEWDEYYRKLQDKLVGQLYTAETLNKARKLAKSGQ